MLTGRSASAECFSDLGLDRSLAGDLDDQTADRLDVHLSTCARCRTRLASLTDESEAFASSGAPLRALPPRSVVRKRGRWLLATGIGTLAAAAALTLVIASPPSDVRRKGGESSVSFFVMRGGRVHRGEDFGRLAPHDTVRFTYSNPEAMYLTIVSVDGAGVVSTYFPAEDVPYRAQPGRDVPLPLSTELDGTLGEEQIWAIFCESAAAPSELLARIEARRDEPTLPAGCSATRLSFTKEAL